MKSRTKRAKTDATHLKLLTPAGPIELSWPGRSGKAALALQHRAIEWTHVVRNRSRWIRSKAGAEEQDARARDFLRFIGVDEATRLKLAQAGTVSVCIPFSEERIGWEMRILPWEFILSAGTRELRTGPLVVTRWLYRDKSTTTAPLTKVLFVESAPGRLLQEWDFTDERRLVEKFTKAKNFKRLVSPTLDELRKEVAALKPGIVHLAGFDAHQGLELIKDPRAKDTGDGSLLASSGGMEVASAEALAAALTPGRFAPPVVFCNIWNSASRIAALAVAAGAGAAIGIQDIIDDALAEIFLGNFYRGLAESQDVSAAFDSGWAALQSQRKPLRGSGIVLWRGGLGTNVRETTTRHTALSDRRVQALSASKMSLQEVRDVITVTVEPETQFSYGLLHNNRDLFQRFVIRNLSDGPLCGLDVFVELHSNEGTYPYRQSFTLDGPVLDLSREIRIALTSSLSRTLDEMLRTSLYVLVKWGEHDVFRQTFPVTLAPVDQWADTDNDRVFLPSFVFPRDRAVGTIIRNAEHFVTALRDDPAAGFDGYQAIDDEMADPFANVDRQVQALWYSVVYRVPASYINPPPTYAVASQRIRTPSEIVGGGFGTCIDLALMVASCMEAVEIYPVIFLLNDHAFPGYWRTDAARDEFLRRVAELATSPTPQTDTPTVDGSAARQRPGAAWSFDVSALGEIKKAIKGNRLVPLESVGLTGRWSLADAIKEGRLYFNKENEDRFLAMIDIMTAREQGVTPLPLGTRLHMAGGT